MGKTIADRISELQALQELAKEYRFELIDASSDGEELAAKQSLGNPIPEPTRTDPTENEIRAFVNANRGQSFTARECSVRLGYLNPKHVKYTANLMLKYGAKRITNGSGKIRRGGADLLRIEYSGEKSAALNN
jgi:hypothetical protein